MKIETVSKQTEALLGAPFEWCFVQGGSVTLIDARDYGGNQGGTYQVDDFAMAKYLVTNSQYKVFIGHPNGFQNQQWWSYSPQATQWRKDHSRPKPTAFDGTDLPRTRVSWFDSVAFCNWLSAELNEKIRLPKEMEWQRAAVGIPGGIIHGAMNWMRREQTMQIRSVKLPQSEITRLGKVRSA